VQTDFCNNICQSRRNAPQQKAPLFDHVVGAGEQHTPHAYLNPLGTPRHAFADGAAPKTLCDEALVQPRRAGEFAEPSARRDHHAARIAEIMRAGAERAEVTVEQVVRELKLIGFSDIRKVVSWRNELVTRTEKGKDGEPAMVLMPRVTIVDARAGRPRAQADRLF
jgi:hypothetical protein